MAMVAPTWYDRVQHTGVFCTCCGAEMDQNGQTGHASWCFILKEKEQHLEPAQPDAERSECGSA